jgi:hypothetical protein
MTDGDEHEVEAVAEAEVEDSHAEAGEVADTETDEVLGDLDDASDDASPEAAVADSLRSALETMREESARISSLETGDEQVNAAERFAEDAGKLDEQLGSLARSDDDPRG